MSAPDAIAYTPREAATVIGVGEAAIREAYKTGQLDARRVGTRIIIPRTALFEWLSKRPRAVS